MYSKRLSEFKSRIFYWVACSLGGYYPSLKEIENSEIKRLASRLKAESLKETLTNLLEWQERNLSFWTERHPIISVLIYIYVILLAIFVLFCMGYFINILLIVLNISTIFFWSSQIAGWFPVIWLVILASSTITTLVIMVSILHFNRKLPWKKVPEGLKNIFAPSISMDFLLKNRWGVCRDFAKLTACLLLNLYPDAEIYFAPAPDHMAIGINIENRVYMLNQRLPILTKNRWNAYRKPRKWHKMIRFTPIKKSVQTSKIIFSQTNDNSEPNIENLAKRMTKLLNINEQTVDKTISFQESITWKNGAILYEDDEIVNYSLARYLKAKISDELLEVGQVTNLEVTKNKDDLIFQISYL